jgi:phosphoribosylanthranilate isomerase
MKVKICGLTNKDDAVWAINYGADYLGFNFYKDSPRHVSIKGAEKFLSELPPFSSKIGIFVNEPEDGVIKAVKHLPLQGLQLHGDETPTYISTLRLSLEGMGKKLFIIKAKRVQSEDDLQSLTGYIDVVDYFLLDAFSSTQMGGTGQTFNWDIAVKAKEFGKPLFLAGGLNSDNVKDAIKQVAPYAVDVASGVEKSPKRKDLDKMRQFILNAKK